jgi:hypothetical protein
MAHENKLLGYCAVDSGQLIVSDPCYLRNWKDGEYDDQSSHYRKACAVTLGGYGGEVLVSGIAGMGVAFQTGWGDGSYPVYAQIKDGRVKKVSIEFF